MLSLRWNFENFNLAIFWHLPQCLTQGCSSTQAHWFCTENCQHHETSRVLEWGQLRCLAHLVCCPFVDDTDVDNCQRGYGRTSFNYSEHFDVVCTPHSTQYTFLDNLIDMAWELCLYNLMHFVELHFCLILAPRVSINTFTTIFLRNTNEHHLIS